MQIPPIEAVPVRFPPGRVGVRLQPEHHLAYRRLYSRAGTTLTGMPVLRDSDFDGRLVKLPREQFEALRNAFARLAEEDDDDAPRSVFEAQERRKTVLFKRLQFLS